MNLRSFSLFSKKSKEQKRKANIYNRYSDLRKSRKVGSSFSLKKARYSFSLPKIKKIPYGAIFFVLFFAILVIGVFMLLTLPQFSVATIRTQLNGAPTELQSVESFKNKNIFLVSDAEVLEAVSEELELPDQVFVSRELPNIINIWATTNEPTLAFLSFSRYCIFDQDLREISCNEENQFRLTDFEESLLRGDVELDAALVQESYSASIPEEEREGLAWKDVAEEEKRRVVMELEAEVDTRKEAYFVQRKDDILALYSVPVLIYEGDWDDISTERKQERMSFILDAISSHYFSDKEIEAVELFTPFDIRIETADKFYLFSTFRSVDNQIGDIIALRNNDKSELQFTNAAGVDVRSEKLILIER